MDSTLPLLTSSLKSVYGTVIDASAPGFSIRISRKFTTSTSRNQSQVRAGGILGGTPRPGSPGAPGRVRAGGGAAALAPVFCCPIALIVFSSGERGITGGDPSGKAGGRRESASACGTAPSREEDTPGSLSRG